MNKFRLDFEISITQKCHHCIHNLHFTLKYNLSTYSNIVAWDWAGQATLLQFCDKLWLVLLWSWFIHTLILHTHKSILIPSNTTVKANDKADLYQTRESIRVGNIWLLSPLVLSKWEDLAFSVCIKVRLFFKFWMLKCTIMANKI